MNNIFLYVLKTEGFMLGCAGTVVLPKNLPHVWWRGRALESKFDGLNYTELGLGPSSAERFTISCHAPMYDSFRQLQLHFLSSAPATFPLYVEVPLPTRVLPYKHRGACCSN